jgi:hypothetical protein
MVMGRPTKYSKEIEQAALEYIENYQEHGDAIPSHAGMCCAINITKSTLYDWAKHENKNFSEILAKCNQKQEKVLLNGGLTNEFNAAITKLALGKQGYSDKIENDNHHVVQTHEEWLDSLE